MSTFFSRVDSFDPVAVGICLLALLVLYGIVRALVLGAERRRFARETKRRRKGYQHRLKPFAPPAPLRAVPTWPAASYRDAWIHSADERKGRTS